MVGRLAACLCVAVIVLVRLDVGAHVLGRHQPHLVSVRDEDPPEMMRTAAGFHRDDAAGMLANESDDAGTARALAEHDTSARVHSRNTARVLAQIDTNYRHVHGPSPSPLMRRRA